VASGLVGAGLDTSTVRLLSADQDLGNVGESSSAGGGKGKDLLAIDYMTSRAAALKIRGTMSADFRSEETTKCEILTTQALRLGFHSEPQLRRHVCNLLYEACNNDLLHWRSGMHSEP
nr:hypothetical protein [Tanacetum cinerariifolium]